MQIRAIRDALNATVLEGTDRLDLEVDHVYASDLMSDVLAFGRPNSILLTGLATKQAITSAHMAEFVAVAFIRGKRPIDGSDELARDRGLVLLSTTLDMFDGCLSVGRVLHNGPQAVNSPAAVKPEEMSLTQTFTIQGDDFASAGGVSTEVKSILKKIGLDPKLVRRVAISTYEGEMNVVMHAQSAVATLSITPRCITVVLADRGKGIPDIEKAMQAGWSTATEEMRAMGFGSGMGLPNIKKNADELNVESEVGKGTTLTMRFYI